MRTSNDLYIYNGIVIPTSSCFLLEASSLSRSNIIITMLYNYARKVPTPSWRRQYPLLGWWCTNFLASTIQHRIAGGSAMPGGPPPQCQRRKGKVWWRLCGQFMRPLARIRRLLWLWTVVWYAAGIVSRCREEFKYIYIDKHKGSIVLANWRRKLLIVFIDFGQRVSDVDRIGCVWSKAVCVWQSTWKSSEGR